MIARGTFAALALASLFVLPMVASAAIVQKWQTASGLNYQLLARGDFNNDGVYELITAEVPSGGTVKIGIRSAATGALLAQSALAYTLKGTWVQDINADGDAEIIVWDSSTGKFNCLHYAPGNNTLVVRWISGVLPNLVDLTFVDLDGNGKLYLVFMDRSSNNCFVYDSNGVQLTMFTPPGAPPPGSLWAITLYAADYDSDNRMEFMIRFDDHNSGQDLLYVYENNAPVGVEPGVTESGSVALGPSYPNPTFHLSRIEYRLPSTGLVSLRLFDVTGREVRTLVNGPVPAGRHEASWDGRDAEGRQVPAGAYFYELNAASQRQTRQVVRLH